MRESNLTENGVHVGTWNKYTSKNPIQNYLVRNFFQTIQQMVRPYASSVTNALDVGCGEGHTAGILLQLGIKDIEGFDISERVVALAKDNYQEPSFFTSSIEEYETSRTWDLVTCFEVLEHLGNPEKGMDKLVTLSHDLMVLSVPNEPLFRTLNLMAFKYVRCLGNSPGHVQHWSARRFVDFVAKRADILEVRKPLPWTVVLARRKK